MGCLACDPNIYLIDTMTPLDEKGFLIATIINERNKHVNHKRDCVVGHIRNKLRYSSATCATVNTGERFPQTKVHRKRLEDLLNQLKVEDRYRDRITDLVERNQDILAVSDLGLERSDTVTMDVTHALNSSPAELR